MREEKDMRVVNFGSLNIDYVYRVDHFVQPGETMSAQSLQIQCGGKGLNQSVALARAGVETWHAGLIGPEGHFLKETLDGQASTPGLWRSPQAAPATPSSRWTAPARTASCSTTGPTAA